MKAMARLVGLAAIVGAVAGAAAPAAASSPGTMRVGLVEGDVQVRIAETGEWAPVAVNTPILEGDAIWVPDGSRVELQTGDGSYIRLREYTAFDILRMDAGSFQFHLDVGSAYVLSRVPKRVVLQIDTPDASVRAFGKARFRVDVPDGETDVAVLKGSVLAESDEGTTKVRRGEMLVVAPDGYAELSPLPEPDEWERWNRERDRIVLARGESTRHLPDELAIYAGDFDINGRWVYVQDYGYCWTPTVVVIRDWAPYRHGRWVWRGGDYVWIGYEPWGWAPYHYGRWAFVARVGWCWVPPSRGEVIWGPGYVGWVRTPEYVAWVPLAPREIYYGHGDYGRFSVNVAKVNIGGVRVTNVYRNVNVVNSVTVVNQTTFVTGRHAPLDRNAAANAREDFTRRRNIVVGRPPVKPTAESHVPVVRPIPEAKRPPAAVRRIDARQLRQSRPLVREPDRSALRPEERPRSLEVRRVEKARPPNERIRERRERAVETAPRERGRPETTPAVRDNRRMERPQAPPEKAKPGPAPKATERAAPPERRERAVGTAPPERPGRETPPGVQDNRRMERPPVRPQAPPQRTRPEATPDVKTPPSPPQPAERERQERAVETSPRERKPGEISPGSRDNRRLERPPVRPRAAPQERTRPEATPEVKTPPSPPPPAERGAERRQKPDAPAERSRARRSTDNTTRP